MNAQPVPRQSAPLPIKPVLIGGLLVILFFLSFASLLLDTRPIAPIASVPPLADERIVYVVFGRLADTVYSAPAANPERRTVFFQAPHADQFGIVASLSPDGRAIAYNALPPGTMAPSPESPAELWLRAIPAGEGRVLAGAVDLRVRPLWSAASDAVVFRRSTANGFSLYLSSIGGGIRELVTSGDALFPVAFSAADSILYYVALSDRGSDLFALAVATAETRHVGQLSQEMTRDWVLSPAGDRLAFLSLSFSADRVASRAMVFDFASGTVSPAGGVDADEFNPTWNGGSLVVGRLAGERGVVEAGGAAPLGLSTPTRGFDVPQGWSASGTSLIVRTFEGSSASAPGRSVLNLLTSEGGRIQVASGEVTFLGWTSP